MAILVVIVLLVAAGNVAINEYLFRKENKNWMYTLEYLSSHIEPNEWVIAKLASDPLEQEFSVSWVNRKCVFTSANGNTFKPDELKIKRDDAKSN